MVGAKIDKAELSAALLDDVKPLVECLDAATDYMGMKGIPHAKEQRVEATHIHSG